MKVFVSYARTNKSLVLEIVKVLSIHDVWIDTRLVLGDDWWQEIEHHIADSDCVLFALSPESANSEYCSKELEYARKLNKPIAPIQIANCAIPEKLQSLQVVDFKDGVTTDTTLALLNGLFEIERQVFNPLRRDKTASSLKQHTMSIQDLTCVTTNTRKLQDYERILNASLQNSPISLPDIQHVQIEEVVLHKAREAYRVLQRPVFAEHSGLAIRAWGGLPGGLTTTFIQPMGLHNICKMVSIFDDTYAEAISVIAFVDGMVRRTFVGRLPGNIADAPRLGERNWSWETIFIPQGFDQTLSELGVSKTLSISMRRRAVIEFMRFLQANYQIS